VLVKFLSTIALKMTGSENISLIRGQEPSQPRPHDYLDSVVQGEPLYLPRKSLLHLPAGNTSSLSHNGCDWNLIHINEGPAGALVWVSRTVQ